MTYLWSKVTVPSGGIVTFGSPKALSDDHLRQQGRDLLINFTATDALANVASSTMTLVQSSTPYYTLTAVAGPNGSITPPLVDVAPGANQTFAIAPASGYAIGNVTTDATSIGVMTAWTFKNVQAAHTIAATFIPTITATAGANGGISPSGTARVASGSDQTYTIAPIAGYHVADVLVDGTTNAGPVSTYTFTSVTVPHTISATFAQNDAVIITASGTDGGSISPTGDVSVVKGTNETFTITPASGYAIANVTVDETSIGVMTAWTFSNVQIGHTIAATFIPTITATAGANGGISPSGTARVASGASQTYSIAPGAGYSVTDVLIDGTTDAGAVSTYTFSSVTVPHTISATFTQNGYATITASGTDGGSISPSGDVSVVVGTNETFTVAPATGYAIGNVTVDGTSIGVMTGWTYTNVKAAPHSIVATFIPTITATASAGGSISPSGTARVASGANQTYTITPSAGYSVTDVLIDGTIHAGPVSTYTFSSVTVPHTISATLAQNPAVTITVIQGANGSISPAGDASGNISVVTGTSSPTFTITPASGYKIGKVLVDGTSIGVMTSWTFSNVQGGHTITATFNPTIAATASANGSISPSGTTGVVSGANQTYTMTPSAGYHVADVLIDGATDAGAVSTYTFSSVTAPHTISVSFALNPAVNIVVTQGANGSITPTGDTSGDMSVITGTSSPTFTIVPASGYKIGKVLVDGTSIGVMTSWTFTNVQAAHAITASFILK